MSRVQTETRRHSRGAAVWAATGGALVLVGGLLNIGKTTATVEKLLLAGNHVLTFGMVGDLWLAALLRYLSAQPSRAHVSPRVLSAVFVVWNAAVLATGASLIVRGDRYERFAQPLPVVGTVAALLVLLLVLPVMLRRLSGISPVAWLHVGALVCLVVGLGFGDLAFYAHSAKWQGAMAALVITGFVPFAGLTLFFAAWDFESYEDKRLPIGSAIAVGAASLVRMGYAAGSLSGNGVNFFTFLAGFGVLIATTYLLHLRWRGGLAYWYERLAFAGTIGVGVTVFLGLERPLGSPIGWAVDQGPSFLAGILLWAAGFALMLQQRDPPRSVGRWMMWPAIIGGLAVPVLTRVTDRIPTSALRVLSGVGFLLVGIAVLTLALHLLRRPRLRAVR